MPREKLPLPIPRFINPASVEIGDTIRVAWNSRGIEHTRTATVYRIIDEAGMVAWFTKDGAEIMHWCPPKDKEIKVTLLGTAKPVDTMLALFEDGKIEVRA